jgi:hypothetical protein
MVAKSRVDLLGPMALALLLASLLLSIRKNTLFGKWPAPLANWSARYVAGRPTGQQEVDDEINSEVANVDSKVASRFIMILNIADEITT